MEQIEWADFEKVDMRVGAINWPSGSLRV
ncbi:hypothetical protein B738_21840 [Photorhabdus temperata subsp. temperata M1021]|nr:hypothetical protein B738_21840 [Photorhabdus temperata subsp. temperata M1021]